MQLGYYLHKTGEGQRQFARRSGVPQPTVHRLIHGQPSCNSRIARLIELATGGEVDRLEVLYPGEHFDIGRLISDKRRRQAGRPRKKGRRKNVRKKNVDAG